MPGFAARQIADWLYRKEIRSIDEMTNLSIKMRAVLSEYYEMGLAEPLQTSVSADGTKKYLYSVLNGKFIETAFIPEKDRASICVSSQAGCKMGCVFCMTCRQGFQGNLSSNEILNQFRSLPEYRQITNMVYMGMGEPLINFDNSVKSLEIFTHEYNIGLSRRKITLSTSGIPHRI